MKEIGVLCMSAVVAISAFSGPSAGLGPSPQAATLMCAQAAKRALGSAAIVLRCGDLTGSGALEVLAVTRIPGLPDRKEGIPVSRLWVGRQFSVSQWVAQLETDDQRFIKNSEGYVGVYFIDDSNLSDGYLLSIDKACTDGSSSLALELRYVDREGKFDEESLPLEVCWNASVRRFQEHDDTDDPEGFHNEVKNPKHFRSKKP